MKQRLYRKAGPEYGTMRRWLRDYIRSDPMGVADKLEWGLIIVSVVIAILVWCVAG